MRSAFRRGPRTTSRVRSARRRRRRAARARRPGVAARSSAASSPSTASAQASTARRAAASSTSGAKRPSTMREVERGGARVAVEVEVGELGDRRVGDRVGGRELGDRLVVQAALVAPGRGDDVGVQVVLALGVLLDRQQDPAAVALAERPVLGRGRRSPTCSSLRVIALPLASTHEVALARPDADRDAVVGVVGAVDEAEVLDRRARSTTSQTLCQPLRSKSSRRRFHSTIRSGPSIRLRRVAVARRPRASTIRFSSACRLAADLVGARTPRRRRPPRRRPARPRARGRGASCACGAPTIAVATAEKQDEGDERADEDQERDRRRSRRCHRRRRPSRRRRR